MKNRRREIKEMIKKLEVINVLERREELRKVQELIASLNSEWAYINCSFAAIMPQKKGEAKMKIGGYTINRKTKIYGVSSIIGDCRRDGLWGFCRTKPFSVFFECDDAGRRRPNVKYFDDMETASQYREAISCLARR